jgi:hypothetical protein
MPEYANRATKEIIVSMAGCVGFADALIDKTFRNSDKAVEHLEEMKNQAQRAMDAVIEGLDADQLMGVYRYCDHCQLMVFPTSNPVAQHDYYMVADKDMDVILSSVSAECSFCDKSEKEVKKCALRKALLNCGIVPNGHKDCPYKG